jgi:hypothetical protein
MAYDTARDQALNTNTTFVKPQEDAPAATTVVQPEQRQALNTSAAPAQTAQQPQSDFPHPSGAPGPQTAALQTVQSEPTPQINKPPLDPRPWAWLQKNNPHMAETFQAAADATGVSPVRLAAHAYAENKFNQFDKNGNVVRGKDGEIGMMQLMPSTIKSENLNANGKLDPTHPEDNVLMAAMYINKLDAKYGQDSINSVRHYNGSGPKSWEYAQQLFPGAKFDTKTVSENEMQGRGGKMNAGDLVKAGNQGPTAFLSYATSAAPAGFNTSDTWRQAEATLVQAFLRKGDLAGAQHARDFVLQLSHAGSNQNLMAAHQALSRGDGYSAATYLARAHAFFPDGTMGRFRTDGKNVFAERVDESDPSTQFGPPIPITSSDVAGLLNQTTDPGQYLKMLNENQKAAADARLKQLHGEYYAGSDARAQTRADATRDSANIHANATIEAANIRAGNAANKPNNALAHEANKDADSRYSDLTMPDAPLEQRAQLAGIHKGAMQMGATGTEAEQVARGLAGGNLKLLRGQDGTYGVVGADNKVMAYLPKSVGDRLVPQTPSTPQQPGQQSQLGPQQAPASPIGAGANTPYAAGAGVTSNLAGTQTPASQSSALPLQQ